MGVVFIECKKCCKHKCSCRGKSCPDLPVSAVSPLQVRRRHFCRVLPLNDRQKCHKNSRVAPLGSSHRWFRYKD